MGQCITREVLSHPGVSNTLLFSYFVMAQIVKTTLIIQLDSKCLSVRHIIVWAHWALMGPWSEVVLVCMFVCTSVHNGFTTEVYAPFELTICRMEDLIRGEMTTPGQKTHPEVKKTF